LILSVTKHASLLTRSAALRRMARRAKRFGRRRVTALPSGAKMDSTLAHELRELGPERAIAAYQAGLRRGDRAAAAYKLARTYALTGEPGRAADVLRAGYLTGSRAPLLSIEYSARSGVPIAALADLVPTNSKRDFFAGLSVLSKSVTNDHDLEHFMAVARQARASWSRAAGYYTRLGHAARRAGNLSHAIQQFEQAVRMARPAGDDRPRHIDSILRDPWQVAGDLFDAAGSARDGLFPFAGTLLGFIREGGFISHDYDLDFGMREVAAHNELRTRLTADWRFDVDRGRSPDVLKVKHINGTAIDIYLFRPHDGGWSTHSHVYGWRFRDFDLQQATFGGLTVQIPSQPDEFLAQMYGDDWQVPKAGFESGLYAPNCDFPRREEMICAVLNKVVSAVRAGASDRTEQYTRFLEQHFEYRLPEPGSARNDLLSEGDAIVLNSVIAPHKSRKHEILPEPSFRAKMDQRIRRRRYLLKYTEIVPVSRPLTNKVQRDRIFADLNFPIPAKLLDGGSAEEVVALLDSHPEIVIKPVKGSGSKGVRLLRRVDADTWCDLRTAQQLTRSGIAQSLAATRIQGSAVRKWFAEELVVGSSNALGHPMDYKLYMFQGRCALIVAKRHLPDQVAFRWFTPTWHDIDTGKYGSRLDLTIPPPSDADSAIELAGNIAAKIPLAFVRVDLIQGNGGLVLSELSPLPGEYHRFSDAVDAMLGSMWEFAENELWHDFFGTDRFRPAIEAIRAVSGAKQLYPE
jgi:hypothetical protein